ncbi:MAG: methionyl-tRNA formyltransferase, partial [Erysipelotrichaceae bacterium]|nr:methionyl-tRNA formyltransferase [Erysipelotrichaceae bacterium]
MNERIVFMGTPEFGRAILQELLDEGRNVVGVVTQPDKLVGRRQQLTFSPVKQLAVEKGIPVIQPVKIREDYQETLDLHPDLIVTCAYGQIIPKALLDAPKLGCINVHASLLPALRGGAPIQHSIIDGYSETGITIMEMAQRMDAGAIISQVSTPIEDKDTYGSLHDRLITLAVRLLRDTLPSIIDGSYEPVPQNEEEVTFGYNISKEEEHIDLSKGYRKAYDQMRGLIPQPCGYLLVEGRKVKIWSCRMSDVEYDGVNGQLHYADGALGITIDGRLL